MKTIEFGHNFCSDGISSWEDRGISPSLFLLKAEYCGSFKYEDDSYIVAKVTKDGYGSIPHLVGKFIVRPAIAKMFDSDRSGYILLDQSESPISKLYEAILNEAQIRENISNINEVIKKCYGAQKTDGIFDEIVAHQTIRGFGGEESFYVTSIPHAVFEQQKQILKANGGYYPSELVGAFREKNGRNR